MREANAREACGGGVAAAAASSSPRRAPTKYVIRGDGDGQWDDMGGGGGGGGTWEPRAENVRWWCWVRPVDPRRVGSGPVAGRLLRKAFWSCPLLVKAAPREGRGGLSNGFRPPLRWFGSGTKSTGFIFFPWSFISKFKFGYC